MTPAQLKAEIERLRAAMKQAEEMLRHPTDPFVLVNVANYLEQERRDARSIR